MSDIPSDIFQNILSRLPAKSLFRLKSVCKLWKQMIEDPIFIKSHTKHQHSSPADILIRDSFGGRLCSISLDTLNQCGGDAVQNIDLIPLKQLIHRGLPILGQLPAAWCNGLILLTNGNGNMKRMWAIWNPLVQDFHEIPPPPPPVPPCKYAYSSSLSRIGFGYDEASDDYKAVRVDKLYRYTANESYRTLIYTLRSRQWRSIEGFPGDDYCGIDGVFHNGSLHWSSPKHGIIALHLGREDYHVLPLPPDIPERRCGGLDELDGCLMLSCGHENYEGMDVWVMKDEERWTKLFSVVFARDVRRMRLVAYVERKGQVFLQYGDSGLIWLDLEDQSSKEITISDFGRFSLTIGQFSPGSLVRLDKTKRKAGAKRKRKRTKTKTKEEAYARIGGRVSVPCVSGNLVIWTQRGERQ